MVMSPPQIRERYHSKIQVTQRNQEVPGQTLRSARFTCPTGRASATTSSRERDHRPRSNKASDCRAERQIARPPVEDLARQRLSLPQGDAAEHDRRSPWSGRRILGRGTSRAYPPAHSRLPPSRRGLPQVMGAVALCWRSHQPASCATGDARERPARAASRKRPPPRSQPLIHLGLGSTALGAPKSTCQARPGLLGGTSNAGTRTKGGALSKRGESVCRVGQRQ
jgi:hypothetical protein